MNMNDLLFLLLLHSLFIMGLLNMSEDICIFFNEDVDGIRCVCKSSINIILLVSRSLVDRYFLNIFLIHNELTIPNHYILYLLIL